MVNRIDRSVCSVGAKKSSDRSSDGPSRRFRQAARGSWNAGGTARSAWPRQGLVEDFSGSVGKIDVPVLVLAGSDDKVDPPQVLREHLLPLVPTATLTELDGVGHLSPLEAPDLVARRLGEFLRSR
ncbi:alpha/beta fold hydrolase [Streptomyces sp. NPDC101234]|uniref:alpha/beta fold hydrolase n=1 Tax=Streptomyces sp. NPDC101234 TaxID=3366138 RepID=UPI0038078A18